MRKQRLRVVCLIHWYPVTNNTCYNACCFLPPPRTPPPTAFAPAEREHNLNNTYAYILNPCIVCPHNHSTALMGSKYSSSNHFSCLLLFGCKFIITWFYHILSIKLACFPSPINSACSGIAPRASRFTLIFEVSTVHVFAWHVPSGPLALWYSWRWLLGFFPGWACCLLLLSAFLNTINHSPSITKLQNGWIFHPEGTFSIV